MADKKRVDRGPEEGEGGPGEDARSVPLGTGDEVLRADDSPGDSGGDGMEGQAVDLDLSTEGEGTAGQDAVRGSVLSPTMLLIEELGEPTLQDLNRELASRIQAGVPTLEQVIESMADAFQDSLAFIAEPVVRALAEMDALPNGYEHTLYNMLLGLEHIRLRSLYDLMAAS